jgi:hypothetical protein
MSMVVAFYAERYSGKVSVESWGINPRPAVARLAEKTEE